MFSTIPPKPKNAIATIDAATSVTGKPLKDLGAGQLSILERTPAKRSIATRNPTPTPREETIASTKFVTWGSVNRRQDYFMGTMIPFNKWFWHNWTVTY